MLRALLAVPRQGVLRAWDRDPALLRHLLDDPEVREGCRRGQLTLHLGSDIVDLHGATHVIGHPLLRAVYWRELHYLRHPGAPCTLICDGGLFVDDVSQALTGAGRRLYTLDLAQDDPAALGPLAARLGADVVISINHVPGLATACRDAGLPLAVWEIDPAIDPIRPEGPSEHVTIHTFRAANVPRFRDAGFGRVHYLPLASNPRLRDPSRVPAQDIAAHQAPVAFVGSSMVSQARHLRTVFLDDLAGWLSGRGVAEAHETARTYLDEVLRAQTTDRSTFRIPELLDQRVPGYRAGATRYDPSLLAGEVAASEKRLTWISHLAAYGVQVWGDEGWKSVAKHGVRYRGAAGHRRQLTAIYSTDAVHVDIGRIYQSDIVTMRVFDVLCCGGFLLAEHSDALADLFAIGAELDSYRTLDELVDKVGYYLARPELRRAIAERGQARVRRDHTIAARVRAITESLARPPDAPGRSRSDRGR